MIYGKLEELERLTLVKECGDFPALSAAIHWMKDIGTGKLDSRAEGRHVIVPAALETSQTIQPEVFANVEMTQLRKTSEADFERHRRYADIQIVLRGAEAFEVAVENLRPTVPYSKERDIEFFDAEPAVRGLLKPGFFVLYRSGEAHRPALLPDAVDTMTSGEASGISGVKTVRKIVIKVLDDGVGDWGNEGA